jgi:peptide/nickel transport system permease protein
VTGVVFLVGLLVASLVTDVLAPFRHYDLNIYDRHLPPSLLGPYQLGTNFLGQDLLRLILVGAKTSLGVGVSTAIGAAIIGTTLGIVSGYRGSWVDQLLMRLVDLQMAFPALILALLVLTTVGPGFVNLVIVLIVARWPVFARVARSTTLSLREREFIEAARAIGCGPFRIMWRHILPDAAVAQLTLVILEAARAILMEGGLSFLGLGIQPPDVSWGLMLAQGRGYITTAWWDVTFPGLALVLSTLSLNFVATWLRARTNPLERAA